MITKIISGGQVGVDRAALDAAILLNIPHGGYCPLGRRADDGVIPLKYNLTELDTPDYPSRTKRNVDESDGTLILSQSPLSGGTLLTANYCRRIRKPHHIEWWDRSSGFESASRVRLWIKNNNISILNVAGPREYTRICTFADKCPGISKDVIKFLQVVLSNHDS